MGTGSRVGKFFEIYFRHTILKVKRMIYSETDNGPISELNMRDSYNKLKYFYGIKARPSLSHDKK